MSTGGHLFDVLPVENRDQLLAEMSAGDMAVGCHHLALRHGADHLNAEVGKPDVEAVKERPEGLRAAQGLPVSTEAVG